MFETDKPSRVVCIEYVGGVLVEIIMGRVRRVGKYTAVVVGDRLRLVLSDDGIFQYYGGGLELCCRVRVVDR